MATSEHVLSTTVWTKVTAAGESGTCWKKEGEGVVIDHTNLETDATLPLSNVNVTVGKSKRVPLDQDNDNVLGLPADDANDIFYALALEGAAKIAVDVL